MPTWPALPSTLPKADAAPTVPCIPTLALAAILPYQVADRAALSQAFPSILTDKATPPITPLLSIAFVTKDHERI